MSIKIRINIISQYYSRINLKYYCRHPAVSRDNGKTSLLGVETQMSYFSQGMCQDKNKEKLN